MMAAAFSAYAAGPQQIVVVGEGNSGLLTHAIARRYLPFATTLGLTEEQRERLTAGLPLVGAMKLVDGKPAAYVCRNFACGAPVTTVEELEKVLRR
jgi:uncharacterized protein YyaL (SSP411 family)